MHERNGGTLDADAHPPWAEQLLRYSSVAGTVFATDRRPLFQNPAAKIAFSDLGFLRRFTQAATGRLVWQSVWDSGYVQSQLLLRTLKGERWFAVEGRIVLYQDAQVLLWTALDIDEQQRAASASRASLRSSEARLRAILSSLSEGVMVHDAEGRVVEANPAARRMFAEINATATLAGKAAEELATHYIQDDGQPFPRENLPVTQSLAHGEQVNGVVMGLVSSPSSPMTGVRWLQVNSVPVAGAGRQVESVVSSFADISRLKHAEQALEMARQRLEVTLGSIGDAVIATDGSGCVEYLNPVAESLTGWSLEDARGCPLLEVFRVMPEAEGQIVDNPVERCLAAGRVVTLEENAVLVARDGVRRPIQDSAAPITHPSGHIEGVVLVFRDVTEERRRQREIHFQASHDALTGLPNRREFERRLQVLVEDTQQRHSEHVMCYLDLDRFKPVNDSCGHAAGDELLRQLANLCQGQCRKHDTLARLGGDEFGLLLEHCTLDQASRVVEELLLAVGNFTFLWEQQHFTIGMSIGMVAINRDCSDARQLLRDADMACYRAKSEGGNRWHIYQRGDSRLAADYLNRQMFAEHGESLVFEHLHLMAQPIMATTEPQYRSLELLLRWEDSDGRLHRPASFFGLAERQTLCARLDTWVLMQALRWMQESEDAEQTVCWINIFPQSLADDDFAEVMETLLRDSSLNGERIVFEIAENCLARQRSAAVAFMERLRPLGCRFALDNCSGGAVVFSDLRHLPIDIIKVQDRLIRESTIDPVARRVLVAVVEVAQLLGRQVVAQGVEDQHTLAHLRSLSITSYQGFLLGRPRELSKFGGQKR